jgi:hypothetical protein
MNFPVLVLSRTFKPMELNSAAKKYPYIAAILPSNSGDEK